MFQSCIAAVSHSYYNLVLMGQLCLMTSHCDPSCFFSNQPSPTTPFTLVNTKLHHQHNIIRVLGKWQDSETHSNTNMDVLVINKCTLLQSECGKKDNLGKFGLGKPNNHILSTTNLTNIKPKQDTRKPWLLYCHLNSYYYAEDWGNSQLKTHLESREGSHPC